MLSKESQIKVMIRKKLKMELKNNYMCDICDVLQVLVTASCEHGHMHLVYVKGVEFSD
jgi:hypothetical protein